jgi:hypothetical protein
MPYGARDVARAARLARAARGRADEADAKLRAAIVAALERNVSAIAIAEAAGVTRQRIYQIRDETSATAGGADTPRV